MNPTHPTEDDLIPEPRRPGLGTGATVTRLISGTVIGAALVALAILVAAPVRQVPCSYCRLWYALNRRGIRSAILGGGPGCWFVSGAPPMATPAVPAAYKFSTSINCNCSEKPLLDDLFPTPPRAPRQKTTVGGGLWQQVE